MNITQLRILKELYRRGILERDRASGKLNIPRTTLYDNLDKLEKLGYVIRYQTTDKNAERRMGYDKNAGERGRPRIYWKKGEKEIKLVDQKIIKKVGEIYR